MTDAQPPAEPTQTRPSSRDDLVAMSEAANERATARIDEMFKKSIGEKLESEGRP